MSIWTGVLPTLLTNLVPNSIQWGAITDALHALTDPWTPYTPVWTGTGSNPVLNSGGVSQGSYLQAGKTAVVMGSIEAGALTSYGSGAYLLSTPMGLHNSALAIGFCWLFDASTQANNRVGVAQGAGFQLLAPLTSGGNVTPSNPYTMASGDKIVWAAILEAA